MSKPILVLTATGKVGSLVVEQLDQQGFKVRAATRSPGQYKNTKQVTWVEFDYDDASTWKDSLAGVEHLFLVARSGDVAPDKSLIPFLDLARKQGVKHVVAMTAMGVEQRDDLGLRKVEKHLIGSGMGFTILRPNWFMQNFSKGFLHDPVVAGGVYLPAADAKVSFIDARDIAAVAVKALTEPGHDGKEYTLTGAQALNHEEALAAISDLLGKDISYVSISDEDARRALLDQGQAPAQADFMVALFQALRAGYAAPVSKSVRQVLGREPIAFETFARDEAKTWR